MLREAGGLATTVDGKDDVLEQGSVVAGNEYIQRDLLKALKGAGK